MSKTSYKALDELMTRQNAIQKKLAKKHLSNGHLVLYDITSSYLEGEYKNSELVKYGYNRDNKKGHEQIVIGLLCSENGCPIGVEVYPGNTKDETTVIDKIKEIKEKYDVKKVIFVGDRGMVTKSNIEKLKDEKDLATISALTRNEIFTLLKNNIIQPSLFDEREIHQIIDPDNPNKRYCLCKNPFSAKDSKNTREKLIDLTIEGLTKIQNYKRSSRIATLGSRIGKILQKYKMEKYINWEIEDANNNNEKNANIKKSLNHKISFSINKDTIKKAELLDGCYIISSNNISKEEMGKNEIVTSYKKLELVETAFRNLKTTSIEVRPIYHKKDKRIKAHVFLCMLSYLVQWHMQQRLKPLFDNDGLGKNRKWSFAIIIETLKQITRNKTSSNGIEFYQNSILTKNQKKIIDYLKIKI